MDTYVFPLRLTIRQRDDGSYVATGKQVPVLLVAKDRASLARKLAGLQSSLDTLLSRMSHEDSLAYLKHRGIELGRIDELTTEEYSVPVLVSA